MTPKEPLDRKRLSLSSLGDEQNSALEIAEQISESFNTGIDDLYQKDIDSNEFFTESVIIPEIEQQIKPQTKEETNVTENKPSANSHVNGSLGVASNQSFNRPSANSKQIRRATKQGEEEMAEVDTAALSAEHGAIRHDIAVESARIGNLVGAEACAINTHIGDSRREQERGFADTRYNVADQAHNIRGAIGDVRQEQAENFGHTRRDVMAGFGDTRYNLAERTGDIRRELADAKDVLNDSIRVEGGSTRFEGAKNTGEIIKEGIKGDAHTVDVVKDARFELASRIESNADRLERGTAMLSERVADRFYSVGRDLADLKQGHATLSKDIELNGLRGIIEGQKNTQYLADKIALDGEKTRALLNDHKYHDLNRALVERQTELVNCEQDRHHYRDRYWDSRFGQYQDQFGAQFAAMQSQLQSMNQNFNSQLSETRQGMVNFGTMAGVGQTSSANNVR